MASLTKDSVQRMKTTLSSGAKQSKGKLKLALIPSAMIEGLASVFTWGCDGKIPPYPERNWEKGILFSEIYSAIQRHLLKLWRREANDTESGISHCWHAMWGCGVLGFYMLFHERYSKFDDRPNHDMGPKEEYGMPYIPHDFGNLSIVPCTKGVNEFKALTEVPPESWVPEQLVEVTEHECYRGWSDGDPVECKRMSAQRSYSRRVQHNCEGKVIEGQAADCHRAQGIERRYV